MPPANSFSAACGSSASAAFTSRCRRAGVDLPGGIAPFSIAGEQVPLPRRPAEERVENALSECGRRAAPRRRARPRGVVVDRAGERGDGGRLHRGRARGREQAREPLQVLVASAGSRPRSGMAREQVGLGGVLLLAELPGVGDERNDRHPRLGRDLVPRLPLPLERIEHARRRPRAATACTSRPSAFVTARSRSGRTPRCQSRPRWRADRA